MYHFETFCTVVPTLERYPLEIEVGSESIGVDRIVEAVRTTSPSRKDTDHSNENAGIRMATSLTDHRWPSGQTLNIHFIGGSQTIHRKVEFFSKEWTNHANLSFTFDGTKGSQIRISVIGENEKGGGNWSRVGTDALRAAPDAPTMNLAVNECMTDAHIRQVVLHEFGHALGFVHEHSSPSSNIVWIEEKVLEYYARTARWSEEMVRNNVFEKYNSTQTQFSKFDPDSIMLYHVPDDLTENGWSSKFNFELSATDKAYAAKWYPYPLDGSAVTTLASTAEHVGVKAVHDGIDFQPGPTCDEDADETMPGGWIFY